MIQAWIPAIPPQVAVCTAVPVASLIAVKLHTVPLHLSRLWLLPRYILFLVPQLRQRRICQIVESIGNKSAVRAPDVFVQIQTGFSDDGCITIDKKWFRAAQADDCLVLLDNHLAVVPVDHHSTSDRECHLRRPAWKSSGIIVSHHSPSVSIRKGNMKLKHILQR